MSTLARVIYSPDTTPPTTPNSVTATALSQTAIRITWGASTDTGGSGLAGYRVYRSTTSTGTYSQIGSDLTTSSLSYDDTGLTAGTTRYYRIVAFDGNANTSSQSATASATTTAASSWADVTVGMSQMPAQLVTDGRKVRMDLTGTDWGVVTDDINGASVTRDVGAAFDGTDAVKIVPPSSQLPNGNSTTYSCIMRGLNLSNGGTKNVAQVNLGFCISYGSRYFDLAHTAKVTGILGSQTIGGATSAQARAAIFENFINAGGGDLRRVFCVTAMTTQAYKEPDNWIDQGPETDFLFILGTASNHANNPPLVATEWLYFEQEVDYRQNRGNPNGRNRLDVWGRGGYLGFLDIPLTWEPTWNFAYQYATEIEYIGALWNTPGTANANNFLRVSHPIVSVNRAVNDRIGPPPGFLL